ncbi:thyroid adenoma-associated protein isoform X2 [Monomorium pharaonis]|uniref:thyroid adenoma-associated protein isoform X2 n=1 Tax=Monomorium pharaonis TaxID=307658 RepID=UPI00174621FE|nr:thyroid adenoma-associated protein isoform X2 [Monomorium pharaonis]
MNENELRVLLSGLRVSKQKGELDTNEKLSQQTVKWRNTLEYSVLETCARHYSEEVRLEMLALLVESKKSTLHFTRMELDIILLFLNYNLCEKMEYIPFVKKALKRLKDSLAVMRRQLSQELKMRSRYKEQDVASEMYENVFALSHQTSEQIERDIKDYVMFFINLRDICVSNLYPDATYTRRRSSLQILLLMQHLLCNEFQDIEWEKEQVETIFQCLLLDTYEPNKEMAYQIIKPMSPVLLHLDSESQVRLIVEVALQLGNSIRPIDSVTAVYMLKISELSPIIRNVLCDYCNVEDNVAEIITLQLVLLLYKKLQDALVLAKKNIGKVIVKNSLYGYLFCMRSLLSDCDLRGTGANKLWQSTVANIILLCFELNHSVSVVVNNSSPEGHLPMDLKALNLDDESSPEKNIITPQMVLLCSWRTVKEVSQLFGIFATKASIQTADCLDGLLTEEQIEHIMKHLVSLLCETKHRGAFEQAYVGFHQLCTRLWRLTNTNLNALPMHWLHDILVGITGLMPGYTKLCATRRSAGVPFMIQAVLSSEPKIHTNSEVSAFHSVMKILLQFSQLESTINLWQQVKSIMYRNTIFTKYEHLAKPIIENRNEYQYKEIKLDMTEIKTHSMNILRALFRHSQLGDMVKNYIADGLMVAFRNYESRTWAERNAATLLFSALIIRVFGVQRTKDHINLTTDNKMTGRIFFERYPSLLPFTLNELQVFISNDGTMIKSNVQAILLLLSRLYISYHFDSTDIAWKINEFVNLVSQCAKSPVHKTRELAARALVPLLTESTAHIVVKKLFFVLCTAQDTQISANLTHGYLLQILEILTRLPSVRIQLLKSDVTDFLRATDWILKGLEKRANGFSCFSIASVYIDILHELYNLDKNMIESCNMEDILHILQQHLVEKDLLRQGPGEQMYKVSIIKFILCVERYSNFLQTAHNKNSKMYDIYPRLLIVPEAEIQYIAWTTVFEMMKKESYQQKKLLSTYTIRAAADFAKDLYKCNPKLQDAVFDFLYNRLMDKNECFTGKREICNLVLREMHLRDANNIYSQRVNYLRLLGKCMTTITYQLKDKELRMKYTENVYRKVCDSSWIGSLCEDFRLSVFDILYELFEKDIDIEHCHPILDWWTMLLQLLVDDNAEVRRDASKLICKLKSCNQLECLEKTLLIFFQNFNEMVADKYPGIAIGVLFCWSVSLGETDYEMDETDVFNKCRNYDVFEPVKISKLCFDLTKSIKQRYSIDSALPPDAVRWINYRLGFSM